MVEKHAREDLFRLTDAGTLQEAALIRAALEREGIRSQLMGEDLTAGFGLGLPGMYPEVWVLRADLPRARAVLDRRHTPDARSSTGWTWYGGHVPGGLPALSHLHGKRWHGRSVLRGH
jgi:hypothetical protein